MFSTTTKVELNLDGRGEVEVRTGSRIFDHFLSQLARHGLFDLKISANGADVHHVVEDVAICLGRAFHQALGERRGLSRMGWALTAESVERSHRHKLAGVGMTLDIWWELEVLRREAFNENKALIDKEPVATEIGEPEEVLTTGSYTEIGALPCEGYCYA